MDYHRENINNLKYRDPRFKDEKYREGSEVITVIYYEVCTLLEDILKNIELKEKKEQIDAIDFVFQCVFYGAGGEGIQILEKRFSSSPFFDMVDFKERKAKYSSYKFKQDVFYSGHVRRLGHYFRNIYQAVKYVEDQPFLTERQKYEYIAHFRAQMTVYEQSIFFFNSVSRLGNVWEQEKYDTELSSDEKERILVFKKLWITKYDLIRNSLNNDGKILNHLLIKEFYPLIILEGEDEFTVSGVLPFENNEKSICRLCFNEKYIQYKNENKDKEIKKYYSKHKNKINSFKCDEKSCKTYNVIKMILKN